MLKSANAPVANFLMKEAFRTIVGSPTKGIGVLDMLRAWWPTALVGGGVGGIAGGARAAFGDDASLGSVLAGAGAGAGLGAAGGALGSVAGGHAGKWYQRGKGAITGDKEVVPIAAGAKTRAAGKIEARRKTIEAAKQLGISKPYRATEMALGLHPYQMSPAEYQARVRGALMGSLLGGATGGYAGGGLFT
jgi:hypothetical protein